MVISKARASLQIVPNRYVYMSLQLHPECKSRLIEKTTDILNRVKIVRGNSLDLDSCMLFFDLDSILPTRGQLRDMLEEYIGDTPMFKFMIDTLRHELDDHLKFDEHASSIPLTKIEGYGDAKALADRLVDELESLPREYSVTISFVNDFGKLFAKAMKEYQISDSVKLFTHDEFAKQIPLQSDEEMGHLPRSILALSKIYEDSTHFQVRVHGLIPRWGISAPIERAVSVFKSFLGLGIALKLFKIDNNRDWFSREREPIFAIHRRILTLWKFERDYKFDASLAETYNHLVLDDINGMLQSDGDKSAWMIDKLKLIQAVFDKQAASKIMLASEWFLDSCGETHKLFSFVQTAVVLEILLGDKARSDLLGLGELLGNRCAYLIARSAKEREYILEIFREFYDIRSRIVHHGKPQVGLRENYLLHQLRQVCCRVISREMELLGQN
jgi:Apea-like HEPN